MSDPAASAIADLNALEDAAKRASAALWDLQVLARRMNLPARPDKTVDELADGVLTILRAQMQADNPGLNQPSEPQRPLNTDGPEWCMGKEPRGFCCRRPAGHAGPHRNRVEDDRSLEWESGQIGRWVT